MQAYRAPLAEMQFVLFDVLQFDTAYQKLAFPDANRELVVAVLDEAARFTEEVLSPLNLKGDIAACRFENGQVRTPDGFKEAYRLFAEGGWAGLVSDPDYGGQGLPELVGAAVKEMIDSANLAWGSYPLLCHGATEALQHVGNEWQREVFLKPIVEGRWTSTMCLTEPHAGSDLGLLNTKAEPQADGSYRITGTKIFITGGEHDLTDNIVHLVLARLPDAPAGTKGISLFVVPKFLVDQSGNMGARNTVQCGSIEHKMGIKGSATCVMNFDNAHGYLLGPPHKGLNAMFLMMNTARLAVGLQAIGLIESAYQQSLAYAKDRLQMRSLSGSKYPDKPADPLIVHPDIRRMLLTQKAILESGRVLCYYAYAVVDEADKAKDEAARAQANELVSFLTPITKGLLTELAVECTYHAQQILGGHGYIQEWGLEQYARDARITTIYEGTTQIQALDLLARKVLAPNAKGFPLFITAVESFLQTHQQNPHVANLIATLTPLITQWQQLTRAIAEKSKQNPEEIGAAAVDYLFYSGYISLAYCWLKQLAALTDHHSEELKQAKTATATFYFQRILPRANQHAVAIQSGSGNLMTISETIF